MTFDPRELSTHLLENGHDCKFPVTACSRIMLLKGLLIIDEGPVFRVLYEPRSLSAFCQQAHFRVHLRAPATCNKAVDHTFLSCRKGSRAFSLQFYSVASQALCNENVLHRVPAAGTDNCILAFKVWDPNSGTCSSFSCVLQVLATLVVDHELHHSS